MKKSRGGARYDSDGNLLTRRKPSSDPVKQISLTLPGSLAVKLHNYCKAHGIKKSRMIARLIKQEIGGMDKMTDGQKLDTDQARNILVAIMPTEHEHYIRHELSGDFACCLVDRINLTATAAELWPDDFTPGCQKCAGMGCGSCAI